ncbi:MAG: hypothetical protein ABJD07_13320 [Gemmatimonadaceae bacterium]
MLTTIICSTALALCASVAGAQSAPGAPPSTLPPVRALGQIVRASTPQFGSVAAVRALSNGNVVVNDITGRRVVLFDSTLANATLVADSTSATAMAYSARVGGLIAYRGDSTLFVDPSSLSMLVIDPAGKVGRVMSVPKSQDATFLIGGPFGWPGFDAQGRLVYRTMIRPRPGRSPDGSFVPPTPVDSAPIIRFDLDARRADTLAYIKVTAPKMNVAQSEGRVSITTIVNPLPINDDWALLSDGRVAIVRGREYRVDWLSPDGAVTKGPTIPFEWQKLSDADKEAIIDSSRKVMDAQRALMMRTVVANGAGNVTTTVPGGAGGSPSGGGATFTIRTEDIGGPPRAGAGPPGGPGGPGNQTLQLPPLNFVSPSELPDYRPAFLLSGGSARGDADGNLWIRTTQVAIGGPVYDVIDGKGQLIDRVVLPPGRTIAGFGRGGIVFLAVRDGTTGVRLEKARLR